jgi:hypothetical protein
MGKRFIMTNEPVPIMKKTPNYKAIVESAIWIDEIAPMLASVVERAQQDVVNAPFDRVQWFQGYASACQMMLLTPARKVETQRLADLERAKQQEEESEQDARGPAWLRRAGHRISRLARRD